MKEITELWFDCPICGASKAVDGALLKDDDGNEVKMGICGDCDEWVEIRDD